MPLSDFMGKGENPSDYTCFVSGVGPEDPESAPYLGTQTLQS